MVAAARRIFFVTILKPWVKAHRNGSENLHVLHSRLPDGCGIIAYVDNGRVVKLEGHGEHEFTRGYLRAKTYRFPKRLYSPERQLHPLKRASGSIDSEWQKISWDEALDLIAQNIRRFIDESGPLSIMHYQRTGSWGATKKLTHRFWNLLGGVTTASGSLCSGVARAGQKLDFGVHLGHDPSDPILQAMSPIQNISTFML